MKRVGSLEIDEDLAFTRREWVFERWGWAILLLLVIAALAGAFGSGVLSERTLSTSDGTVRAKHSRIVRQQTSHVLEIEFRGSGNPLSVGLSENLHKAWTIEQVTAEPEEVVAGANGITYRFRGESPARIRIIYKSERPGRLRGQIQLPGSRTIAVKQTTLP